MITFWALWLNMYRRGGHHVWEILKKMFSHQMVYSTCLILWFLPQAVVAATETSNIKTEPGIHAFKWVGFVSDFWEVMIVLKRCMHFYVLHFCNVSAFKLSVQSKTSLSPGFLLTGEKEMRLKELHVSKVDWVTLLEVLMFSLTWIEVGRAISHSWDAGHINVWGHPSFQLAGSVTTVCQLDGFTCVIEEKDPDFSPSKPDKNPSLSSQN